MQTCASFCFYISLHTWTSWGKILIALGTIGLAVIPLFYDSEIANIESDIQMKEYIYQGRKDYIFRAHQDFENCNVQGNFITLLETILFINNGHSNVIDHLKGVARSSIYSGTRALTQLNSTLELPEQVEKELNSMSIDELVTRFKILDQKANEYNKELLTDKHTLELKMIKTKKIKNILFYLMLLPLITGLLMESKKSPAINNQC